MKPTPAWLTPAQCLRSPSLSACCSLRSQCSKATGMDTVWSDLRKRTGTSTLFSFFRWVPSERRKEGRGEEVNKPLPSCEKIRKLQLDISISLRNIYLALEEWEWDWEVYFCLQFTRSLAVLAKTVVVQLLIKGSLYIVCTGISIILILGCKEAYIESILYFMKCHC